MLFVTWYFLLPSLLCCFSVWAPPLPGAAGAWLGCSKHLAVGEVSRSWVFVPACLCGLRPGGWLVLGRAGSAQSFCRTPVFTQPRRATPSPPRHSWGGFHMCNACHQAVPSYFGSGLGEAQVHNFIIIIIIFILFYFFYKETPKKAVEGNWLPPPKSLSREACTIRC